MSSFLTSLPMLAVLLAEALLGLLLLAMHLRSEHYLRRGVSDGAFVAEAWLDWSSSRGSTLFRAAFPSADEANRVATVMAQKLKAILPATYPVTLADGRVIDEPYDYGVLWGVRARIGNEVANGVSPLWSPSLPGTAGHCGEAAIAHPSIGVLYA